MNIEYEIEYDVIETKRFKSSKPLDDLNDGIEELIVYSKDELGNAIEELIFDISDELVSPKNINNVDYINSININNMDELIKYYSHLIIKDERSCCDNHPNSYKYCPDCGKKLK